jgi:glycine/D-amino acid oxidase-like deaminating enzyme
LEVSDYSLTNRWSGPILESSDGLPLIGEYDEDLYVATAFSGNGMTYSAVSASLLTDLILGKQNPYTSLYDPKRPRKLSWYWEKGKDYFEEFLNGALRNNLKYRGKQKNHVNIK